MLYITQSDLERLKLKRWAMVCWANGNRENRDSNPEIEIIQRTLLMLKAKIHHE